MKFLKKLMFIGLVLCLALGVFAACTQGNKTDPKPEDDKVDYTVTVECEDTVILSTVTVKIMSGVTEVESKQLENGTATFHLAPATYTAELEGALDAFSYTPAALTAINRTATISLTKKSQGEEEKPVTVSYSVTVKKPDGTPVSDIMPQLCGGPVYTCTPSKTDENGVATYELPAGNYEVHIEKSYWPEGCYFDDSEYKIGPAGGNIDVTFREGMTYTVNVYWVSYEKDPQWGWNTEIKGDVIPNAKIGLFKQWYDEEYVQHVDEEPAAEGVTDQNGKVELVAPKGVFVVRILDCPETWSYQTALVVEELSPELDLKVQLRGSDEDNRYEVTEGTYTVEIPAGKGNAGVWYGFTPEAGKSGYYTVKSDAKDVEVDAYLYAGTSTYVNTSVPTASDEKDGDFNIEFRITAEECAEGNFNVWVFKFTAMTDAACSFQVTFAWEKEYVEPNDVRTRPHATETMDQAKWSQYVAPADTTWTWLSYLDAENIVKGSDGFYHVGENGPVVFAAVGNGKIAPKIDKSFSAALMEAGENAVTWATKEPDEDNNIYTYNLTDFFADYAAASNGEGIHPLTEELQKALQHYAIMGGIYNWREWPRESDGLYTFLCGYYKSNYVQTAGEGTDASPYTMSEYGMYKTALPASGEVWYQTRHAGVISFETEGVTLSVNGKDYSAGEDALLEGDPRGTQLKFGGTAGTELVFTFAPQPGSEGNPLALKQGDNTIDIPESMLFDGMWYSFTPTETFVYTLSSNSAAASFASPEGLFEGVEGIGETSYEFIAGNTYLIVCAYAEGAEPQPYTITISKTNVVIPSGMGTSDAPYQITEEGWYRVSITEAEPTREFAFNARVEGHWQIVITNPAANVLDSNLVSHTLGDDETALVLDITAALPNVPNVYGFTMAANTDGATVYFFHFQEVKDSGEGEGGDTEWEGSGTESDPYILKNIVGNHVIHVTGGMWDPPTTLSYTATETAAYNFNASDNAWISISFLNGEIPSTLKDIDPDNGLSGTFTMTEGVTYTITVMDWNEMGNCDVTLTITKA